MATYYIAQGGSGTKAQATDPSTPMSMATHNSETFSADDVIEIVEGSGDFSTELVPPSSGSSGSPIVYNLANAAINPTTGRGVLFNTAINYVTVNGINGSGNGDDSYIETSGAAGAGGGSDEATIIVNGPRILSNGGGTNTDCDGISTNGTSRLIVNNPFIRDCYNTSSPTTGSHQALTAHDSSVLIVNTPNVDNVTQWAVPVGDARITINGGTLKGAKVATLEMSSGCTAASRLTAIGVDMINDQGARPPASASTTSTLAALTVIGGSYEDTSASTQGSNRSLCTFLNVEFKLSDGVNAFRHHTITAGAVTNVIGCDFGEVNTTGGYFFRAEQGTLNIIGCSLDSYEDSTGRFATYDSNANANGQILGNYLGNVVDCSAQGFIWIRGTLVGNVDINFNTFGSSSVATTERLIDNDGVINELIGNTFINISNVIDTAGGGSVTTQGSNNSIDNDLVTTETVDEVLLDDELNLSSLVLALQSSSESSNIPKLTNLKRQFKRKITN